MVFCRGIYRLGNVLPAATSSGSIVRNTDEDEDETGSGLLDVNCRSFILLLVLILALLRFFDSRPCNIGSIDETTAGLNIVAAAVVDAAILVPVVGLGSARS